MSHVNVFFLALFLSLLYIFICEKQIKIAVLNALLCFMPLNLQKNKYRSIQNIQCRLCKIFRRTFCDG